MRLFTKEDIKQGMVTRILDSVFCFGKLLAYNGTPEGRYFIIRLPFIVMDRQYEYYSDTYVTGFWNPMLRIAYKKGRGININIGYILTDKFFEDTRWSQ